MIENKSKIRAKNNEIYILLLLNLKKLINNKPHIYMKAVIDGV
jgi:hypothetical protein